MPVVAQPIDVELTVAARIAERRSNDWAWLDSAIGHADRGKSSMVALETQRVVELHPDHGLLFGRDGRSTVLSVSELLSSADHAFAIDSRRLGGEAPGWIGYMATEAAFCADPAFVAPAEPLPYALLRFDRVVAAVVERAGQRHLVVVGHDADDCEQRANRWKLALAVAPGVEEATETLDVTPVDARPHVRAVESIVESIRAGRIFQACYTFPLMTERPFSFRHSYECLRNVNAGDFGVVAKIGDLSVASVSPERFLQVEDGVVVARPMKGTRRVAADDPDGAAALAGSEKDRAENVMIVDLMRNDLGRVCAAGSIEVPELFAIETYATVHQMTSTVRGRLRHGVGPFGLLRATFPPGSMTGAPKVEACRVLAELEAQPRGVYGGTVGWLGFDGRWTFNVVIRALASWGDHARWDVGGGITALSVPMAEFEEALAKAAPLAAIMAPGARIRRE